MSLPDILFYVFAALAFGCGVMVLASKNPVTSAMFLVLTIASLAGLFVLLQAFFLAAIQILVYAGAVMVLFLFVIMLLDLKAEERRHIQRVGIAGGIVSVGTLVWVFCKSLRATSLAAAPPADAAPPLPDLFKLLFTGYLLPFEIVSVLLLVAMVGVILLSKRDLK